MSFYNILGNVFIYILLLFGVCVYFLICFIRNNKLEDGVVNVVGDRYSGINK